MAAAAEPPGELKREEVFHLPNAHQAKLSRSNLNSIVAAAIVAEEEEKKKAHWCVKSMIFDFFDFGEESQQKHSAHF